MPPIASLPLEILEHIFSLCVPWLYPDLARSRPRHPLAFTEVCRTWHWTARSSPRLWARVDLSSAARTHYALHIARAPCDGPSAPLALVNSAYMKTSLAHIHTVCASLLDYAAGRATGLSEIDVCLYPCVLSSLFAHLAHPMIDFSTLTKLVLRVPLMSAFSTSPIDMEPNYNVPSLSLPVPIPNVRHLELDGVSVHWPSVKNLRYLSLRSLISGDLSPTLSAFQALLHRSQSTLEYCRLESILFSDGLEDTGSAISLPNLHTLSISAAPVTVSSILHSVTVRPSTQILLYTSLQDDLHTLFNPDFSLDESVTALRLSRHSATFLTSSNFIALSISSASTKPLPGSILNSLSHASPWARKKCPGIYPVAFLTSLSLAPGVLLDIPPSALAHLFHPSSGALNLHDLGVGYQCDINMAEFLNALLPAHSYKPLEMSFDRLSTGPGCNASQLPCPNLRSLSFNTLACKWNNFSSAWLDAVIQVVLLRRVQGGLLDKLEFVKCHGVSDAESVWSRMAFSLGVNEAREDIRARLVREVVVIA